MKTYEYTILEGYVAAEISKKVNEHAVQGWELHGNLCIVQLVVGAKLYAQALIRPIEHPGAWG